MDELSVQRAVELLRFSADAVKERRSKSVLLLNLSSELTDVRSRSANKPPYTINIFERYNADEPTTSWALFKMLRYKEGGTYPLLKLFTQKFLALLGFNPEWMPLHHYIHMFNTTPGKHYTQENIFIVSIASLAKNRSGSALCSSVFPVELAQCHASAGQKIVLESISRPCG